MQHHSGLPGNVYTEGLSRKCTVKIQQFYLIQMMFTKLLNPS